MVKSKLLFLVSDSHERCEIIQVQTTLANVPSLGQISIRYFYYQHTKYVYHCDEENFIPLDAFIPFGSLDDLLENSDGVSHTEHQNL